MSQSKSLVLLAGAALSLSGVNAAQAQTASSDEVRAVVAEMLNDAETRSSLLAGGDAGHDGKFFIAGDGFRLNIGGQLQFRYVANFRDEDSSSDNDDYEGGFQTRRSKLDFNGTINKDWFYRVLFNFDRGDGGGAGLQEAFAGYRFANGVKARWGQFKLPLLREELVSSSRQLAAERSLTNEAFTQDRSQGIELSYETEAWRGMFAFSDGLDSENTDFTTGQSGPSGSTFQISGEADYAFTGRFEYMASGNWRQFDDFTAEKGGDFGCLLGVAAHWQQSPNSNAATDTDTQTFEFTFDVSLEGDSWNAYGAYIGRYNDSSTLGGGDTDGYDSGFIIQGGWRFAENTEVFARWDAILPDDGNAPFTDTDWFNFLTVGLNQYYAGHAAKATLDLVYSLDDTSALVSAGVLPDTGVGLLGSDQEGEVVIRLQFQLLF